MIKKSATRKKIAIFFLCTLFTETLAPVCAWALTSGPAQPETQQFAAAGTSDMVDLFTGDFKYNIPLLDVDGYPVNLNYASGAGMDDEASWVGLGWNLNVGAVNRQLRGIADDASGDIVETENYMKPKITVGGRVTARVEVAGWDNFSSIGFNGSGSIGIFSDNYMGYGADVGVGTGASFGLSVSGAQTAGLSFRAGLSLNSSTQDGVTLSPSLSASVKKDISDKSSNSAGISANLGYNTREGLKNTTLGASFSASGAERRGDDRQSATYSTSLSNISYNTPAFYPRTVTAFRTKSNSYGFDVGGSFTFVYLAGGLVGYKTTREILDRVTYNRAFGFMYAEKGKQRTDALMDFMREKDNPVVPSLPNLAVPIATPDLFSYSGQAGGGQFRLYRGSAGTFSDATVADKNDIGSLSAEYGFGAYFHGGVTYTEQDVTNKTGKWREKNDFLSTGDYPAPSTATEETAYFKMIGEKNIDEGTFHQATGEDGPVRVALDGKKLTNQLASNNSKYNAAIPTQVLRKKGRQIRRTPVLALSGVEARQAGLDRTIKSYPFNNFGSFPVDVTNIPQQQEPVAFRRDSAFRKAHHISQFTVQSDNGSRMVYGLPVYNTKQEEYTFSVDPSGMTAEQKQNNLVPYSFNQAKKIIHTHAKTDHYYRRETQPAYATAHLLTGVLSPDYVDLTGDGISDDDPGTAVKFNYSKVTGAYKWRSPYVGAHGALQSLAQYNKGLNADGSDDKGNIIYGEKELWYLHSIESKTKIAYFITEDRTDALGVIDIHGGKETAVRQKRLKEIRIYSKTDMTRPIKTVMFEYDYELCPDIHNSSQNGGKLKLKKVYFKYNNNNKGIYHPYTFEYASNPAYKMMSVDRWGTYKLATDNSGAQFTGMGNDEFPYSAGKNYADNNAAAWQLSKIILPSGGEINVQYESDDYAWVQDRRAMRMMKIDGLIKDISGTATTNLREANGFRITLPVAPEDCNDARLKEWFIRNYLSGKPYLYAKLFVNLSDQPGSNDPQHFDYIPCYGEVDNVKCDAGGTAAFVTFKSGTSGGEATNPFQFAAWQKMRLEYPCYAYPGYKNRIDDDRPVAAAVSALGSAISNFSELKMNFHKRAAKKGFASKVNLDKSFARLACYKSSKTGGGARVKQIRIMDKWNEMATGGTAAAYGQSYEYIMSENGAVVSSGVASYEPAIGGDENPMRMPVPYSQEFQWALTNDFYLEEPMGESLFPAPQVGYRKVTVKNLDQSGAPSTKMGATISEFYTAKEFPVVVTQTNAEKVESETKRWYPFFGGDYAHEVYMSQGYAIQLNDMHGKPFRESVLNQKEEIISSMEYRYSTAYDEANGRLRLNNYLPVVWDYQKPNAGILGREVELFTDLREQETASTNKIYNAGVDVIPFLGYPVPFPHIPLGKNNDYKLFRSASILKTVQDYGVLVETVKTVNGSTITTTHEMFDQATGEPVITKTQNEFEDPVYTINIPAYYSHKGMGMAYQTLGMVIPELVTEENGEIQGGIKDILQPGDELIDLDNGNRSWVILSANQTNPEAKLLIDAVGRLRSEYVGRVKVCRSGYRNMLTATGASFVTLKKPGEYLYDFFSGHHTDEFPMLNAKATLYHEAWGRPSDCNLKSCPDGYNESDDGTRCMLVADRNTSTDLNIVAGDQYSQYGSDGTQFTDETGQTHTMTSGYWTGGYNGRLNKCGIWLNNHNAVDAWWGFEECFEVSTTGNYYLGFASDNNSIVYIDNEAFNHDYNEEWTSDLWRIYTVHLTAGPHRLKVVAKNAPSGGTNYKSFGLEIYATTQGVMLSGSNSINDTRIFTTESLRGVNTTSTFKITDPTGTRTLARYNCPAGKTLSQPCDGTPNCGYKEKGDCPDGYNKSPDGQSCIPVITPNSSPDLNIQTSRDSIEYDKLGGYLFDDISPSGQKLDTSFFSGGVRRDCTPHPFAKSSGDVSLLALGTSYCGRLNESGIRLTGNYGGASNMTGITSCFQTNASKTYYIGMSGRVSLWLYIDDVLFKMRSEANGHEKWHVYPISLTAGSHTIRIEAQTTNVNEAPVMGVEIYDCTRAELLDVSGLSVIWSTLNPVYSGTNYNSFVRFASTQTITAAKTLCGGKLPDACKGCEAIPNGGVLNPYVTGYLGNWASWKDFVYLDSRNDNGVFNPGGGLNIRKSGTFTLKTPFYYMQSYGGYEPRPHDGSIPGWVTAREVTMHDRNMQELENKDALGRYSSARYGYRGILPVAVASNARHREIFYDGFEDYKFFNHSMAKPTCDAGEFDIRKTLGADYQTRLDMNNAHTGRYSLKLTSPVTLQTWQFNEEHTPGIYLSNHMNGEFYRSIAPWLGLWGFAPMNAKEYVFSAWVKDGAPLTDATGITVTLNGSTSVTLTRKATVEGWKLVEGHLTIPAGSPPQLAPVSVTISGGANILVDDIRIFPFDAQIKTYSYDDRTLRLMGEMDENNYATYYEYDDEGSLVRVKKETERGIVTIKESRTSYKKQTL